MDGVSRYSWLRSARTSGVLLVALIVLFGVAGYALTSATIRHDRDEAAEQRAQIEVVHAQEVLGRARAYVGGLADVLAREQAVIEEKSRNEGVPEAKLEGAVKGRLNAFYKDIVLLEQPSVKDPKVSIAKLVENLGGDAKLTRFARVKVGED